MDGEPASPDAVLKGGHDFAVQTSTQGAAAYEAARRSNMQKHVNYPNTLNDDNKDQKNSVRRQVYGTTKSQIGKYDPQSNPSPQPGQNSRLYT